MTPQEFYSQYLPHAEKVSNQTGLDPRLVLAQAALETGYGKSAPNMNFFGIKSHGKKGGQTLQTSEFEGGKMVGQPASFRGYGSPDQSFQDYANFLKSNPRYEGVLSAKGLEGQIAAMADSGYATDPDYGAKLANIAGKFDPSSAPIIASDTMRVLGKQQNGLLGTAQAPNNTESKMIPEEEPRGLLGSLGIQKMEEGAEGEAGQRFFERDTFKDTAANLAQGFAAMGSSPALQKMTADVASQRTESKAKNKTIEYLRSNGRGDLADAVESGSLGIRDAAGIMFSNPKAKTTAAEDKIARIMSTGVSEETAIGIVDGRNVVRQDEVTGEVFVYDVATGQKLFGEQGASEEPTETTSTPGVFDDTNVKGATGLSGFGANILNTVVDAFGQGQPADKIAKASTALQTLSTNTSLGMAGEFPGRPSNLTRGEIRKMTILPGELSQGPEKALNKANSMIRSIDETMAAANRVLSGRYSPADKASAKASIDLMRPLLNDYTSLAKQLQPDSPAASVTISESQNDLLNRYAPEIVR
jgi:hypothetical protein